MSSKYYEVVYYNDYGGFGYPQELFDKLDELYPPESESESEFGKKLRIGTQFNFSSSYYNNIWRTSPEIIKIMRENNWLTNKNYKTQWGIKKIPIGYDYKITEYDGKEQVHIICPIKEIITDLLRVIETGNYDNINKITQKLLSKDKTIDEVLYPK